jgi:hypothetical protein
LEVLEQELTLKSTVPLVLFGHSLALKMASGSISGKIYVESLREFFHSEPINRDESLATAN